MRPATALPPRLGAVLCGLYTFLLAFLIQALFVERFAVDVPYWDEWVDLPFWAAHRAGTLTWHDLFAQHNEHRITVARLAFVGLYDLFGEWNMVTHMVVSALFMGLTVGVLAYTLYRVGVSPLLSLALSLILTSPVQWDQILMGYQIQACASVFGVILALCAVALDDALRWRTVAIGVVGCLISSFSFGSGLGSWAAAGAALLTRALLATGSPRALLGARATCLRLAAFALAALAGVALYFIDYTFHPSSLRATDLATSLGYLGRLLSNPLLDDATPLPLVALAVVLWLCVGAAMLGYWRRRQRPAYRDRLVLFVGLLLFLVAVAAFAGYRRGATPYVPSRYATLFQFASVLWLVAAADLSDWSRRLPRGASRASRVGLGLVVVALLLVHSDRYLAGLAIMQRQRPDRAAAKEAVAYYLADHSPNLPFRGFAVFPPHVLHQGDLGRPALLAALPPDMSPSLTALPVEMDGDAWGAAGAFEGTAGPAPPQHWGTWRRAGATATGRIRVGPLTISQPVLRIPIAGYFGGGTSLIIEDAADRRRRLAYAGASPGDAWVDWSADVSAFIGREVLLVGVDASRRHPGWLAFGRPRPLSRALARFDAVLSHVGLALQVVVLAGVGLLLTLAHTRRAEP